MSDQTMNLDDGTNNIDISVPVFGYRTTIDLPFDIARLSNGKYAVGDTAGSSYDVRTCECEVVLSSADVTELNDFLSDSDKGRASSSITLTLTSGSGLHLFGPDKGDDGPFTVAMSMLEQAGIGPDPWLYYKARLLIVNQGSWPAYSLPSEVSDGTLTIDTISGVRFPPDWFNPDVKYASEISLGRDGAALFVDRSTNADSYDTEAIFVMNESKMAAFLNHLVGTTRNSTFTLTTASNQDPFGADKGGGSDTVRLAQSKIVVTHHQYDRFSARLRLSFES